MDVLLGLAIPLLICCGIPLLILLISGIFKGK